MKPSQPIDDAQKTPAESSLLKQALLAIQQTQAKLDAAERRNSEPIAIVGIGCRFPGGAVDGETFWELVREGRDAISVVPRDRWDVDAYFDPDPDAPGKMVTRWGGFLDRVDGFDARFFEIAPREAAGMDPQQRLALEVAWETLENAGIAPASLHGTRTGVFLGIASSDYSQLNMNTGDPELMDAHYASGVAHSIASGRISYLLGLEGPGVSLDTACSSSLVAVHLACQSLRAGDCTLALAGGVNLILAPETTALLSRVRMLSPDGRCKAFDEKADGFVRGEGCGFVALKRLSQAQADGDRILAVIRGTAVNQDGASSSLTAPNGPSQVNLMRQALENGGVAPSEVSYIEAHGTGTALGDPIELQSLGAVYGTIRAKENLLPVGSLKTNIGHLEAAAGVAGLIKAILALQHRQIPPSLHCERPTSHVRWEELRLRVPTKLIEWESVDAKSGSKRVAAVSSFGFSGTNAHVVVEEAACPQMAREASAWPLEILCVSAKSATALQRSIGQYRQYLEKHPDTDLRDFCFTANTGRSHFSHRACFLAPDVETMKEQLAGFAAIAPAEEIGTQRIGYLFTGQGSQYAGMGRELYESSSIFRSAMERCAAAYARETGGDLIAALYGDALEANNGGAGMESARVAQAGLFAVEFALAEMWRSWGAEPSVLLGHSLGEYGAAVVAGIFSVEDGMRLVCARARLMETLAEPGAMQSIAAPEERVRAAIAGHEKEVSIAAVNARESVVISGRAERVAEIADKLESEGIRTRALPVTHAFHSPLLEPILEEFEQIANTVEYHAAKIRVISNLTGKAARPGEMATPRYWREHMRNTVLFDAGLKAALETGCRTWIEIGPQPHLTTLGKSTHSSADIAWLPSMRKGRNAWLDILAAVQTLYLQGAEIDWKALHGKSGRLALPTYPFERERHWFQAKKAQPPRERFPHGHPLLGERVRSPLAKIQFESRIDSGHPAYLGDHVVAGHRIVPAAAYLEMALSAGAAVKKEATLREIAFLRPCIFDEPRILQCVLDDKDDRGTFAIYSRSDGDISDAWTLHATGALSAETETHIAGNVARLDLTAIRSRCTEEIAASAFYGAFQESDAHFGPSFRPVTKISRSATEALLELDFVSEVRDDAAPYRIHPVALDACFQAVVALLMNASKPAEAVYLPAALESLRILGDPRKLAGAHAQICGAQPEPGTQLTADLRGVDAAGNVLVHAKGLVLRPMQAPRGDSADTGSLANAFYEVAWTPLHAATERYIRFQGTCVLEGDETIARSFAASLERSGARAVVPSSGNVSADDAERETDAEFSQIARPRSASISDVFYIAPRATEDSLRLQPDRLMELEADILGESMRLAQALLRIEQKEMPRLWIVTRGAQGPAATNVAQSALWGFGRAVAAEHPEMRVVRIDLDPADEMNADALLRSLPLAILEEELVLRGKEMYAPRLRPLQPESEKTIRLAEQQKSNLRLELVRPGTLEGIEAIAGRRRTPEANEVEIQVAAAGLNFRDVMSALGMYPGKSGILGGECAGTVVAVGAGVESLHPGDEVVALGQGCFAEFVTTRADMVWPKPANLSFEAAVTIPVTFLTAWYALKTIAAIQPGESVLIHAGAGGVGLAAIQIAQKAGAIVFATAGSREKRDYLSSIGVHHVFDSRSLDFVREVSGATDGRGVDVVLNSLAGKFVDAGLEVLAPRGRFIEIGVADIRSAESVARVRPDITYHPFNLAPALEAGDRVVREIVTTIFEQFRTGALQPLPRKLFALKDGREAFRTMAQARHIGRVVIVPDKSLNRRGIRRDGAYLVTGGMSGVGLAVAEWLAKCGAVQVIVMGRSPADAAALKSFEKMRDAGTTVSAFQGDVTNKADVQAAFDLAKDVPLRGIFHCAGVLDDGALLHQNWERFERVLAPKVAGAWNLHRLSADLPLDHFVLFSSIASVFGSPGQTNYAAANAFLDGLAQYRHTQGLPALSVNWGAWSETGAALRHGVLERQSKLGMKCISTCNGVAALEQLIAGTHSNVVVAPIDWEKYMAVAAAEASRPFFSDLKKNDLRTERARAIPDAPLRARNSSWLPQLRNAAPARQRDLLLRLLEERVQTTLGIHSAQAIDPNQPLQELGLDSLLSIELRNSLSASLECSLPATLLFNYPTLNAIAPFLLRQALGESAMGSRRNDSGDAAHVAPADLVHDIESLSDEEVERLLNARAMEGAK